MLLDNRFKIGELIEVLDSGEVFFAEDAVENRGHLVVRQYSAGYREQADNDGKILEPLCRFEENGSVYIVRELLRGRYAPLEFMAETLSSALFYVKDINSNIKNKWLAKKSGFKLGKTEQDVLLKFKHTLAPKIHDAFEQGGAFYTIRDYEEGESLKKKLDALEGPMGPDTVYKYAVQLCGVLEALHNENIYHLDLKCGNIILGYDGFVHLIDFGIATINYDKNSKKPAGTPGFAAPEQSGDSHLQLSKATDVFGFGATLYNLLTKKTAARGFSPLPADGHPIYGIVNMCMELNPNRRYQNFTELRADLEAINSDEIEFKAEMRRRLLRLVASAFMCAFSVLMLFAGLEWMGEEERAREEAGYVAARGIVDGHIKRRDYGQALQAALGSRAAAADPAVYAWLSYMAGEACFRSGDYPAAAGYFREALEYDEGNAAYRRQLAVSLARTGDALDLSEALAHIDILPPDGYNTLYAKGFVLEANGLYGEAMENYAQCYGAPESLRARAYLAAAELAFRTGGGQSLRKKIDVLEEFEANPTDTDRELILGELIDSYIRIAETARDLDEREAYYEKALEARLIYVAKVEPSIQMSGEIALRYRVTNMPAESRRALDSAMETFGNHPDRYVLYFHYAMLELSVESRKARDDQGFGIFVEYAGMTIDLAPKDSPYVDRLHEQAEEFGVSLGATDLS